MIAPERMTQFMRHDGLQVIGAEGKVGRKPVRWIEQDVAFGNFARTGIKDQTCQGDRAIVSAQDLTIQGRVRSRLSGSCHPPEPNRRVQV